MMMMMMRRRRRMIRYQVHISVPGSKIWCHFVSGDGRG
jgi:hypothetical protein